MEKVQNYSNTAALVETDRRKLVELINKAPLGIYKTSMDMGVMPQAIYRLMAGKGVRMDTFKRVYKFIHKNQPQEDAAAIS